MDPFGLHAVEATRRHVLSARPAAPVVPGTTHSVTRTRGAAVRRLAATTLRRLADHVEPGRVEPCRMEPYAP